ncbi:STAS domain-containing protein [Sinomonas sp. G460-2]|uniref:STAS domain-containing protein n=1 Tax=Sinomonas sp. G460-2 TaxID=3393464 RepID=UPI0039F03D33
MTMDFAERDGLSVLALQGRLNVNTVDEFRGAVTDALRAGNTRLLIDLRGTDWVDSTGLGALVWAATAARREGGDLRLVNVGENVRMLLKLTSVEKALPVVDDHHEKPETER